MIYVAQIMTGTEDAARMELRRDGFTALVPEKQMYIRRGGVWHTETRVVFPGYIFIGCGDLSAADYHLIKKCPGYIRLLGVPVPQPIPAAEAEYIRFLSNGENPIEASKAYITLDGQLEIISGSLKAFEDNIIWYSRRQRRAEVETKIAGVTHRITFAVDFM